MALSKARHQHFVPRFYLTNFGDRKIFCFDKINNKDFETNAGDIALGKNFYEVGGLGVGEIEKFLSVNESKFRNAYYELIDMKDISKLDKNSFQQLFLFIGLQFVRTPVIRLELENVLFKAYDKLYSRLATDY
jgi:hypothetical protein